jgi:hypothetical protein
MRTHRKQISPVGQKIYEVHSTYTAGLGRRTLADTGARHLQRQQSPIWYSLATRFPPPTAPAVW